MKVARITKYLALFMIMAMISACHDFTLSWKVRIFKNTSIPQTFQSLRAGVGFCGLTGTPRARRETYSLSFWTFAVLNTAGIGRICAC